ncbi:MAG: polyphosphate kinase 2 family protein [Pseudolabrys sp.]
MKLETIAKRFRVDQPKAFELSLHDPAGPDDLSLDKGKAEKLLDEAAKKLGRLQQKLYAQDRWSVLIVLQGMDAAGKDGIITHVMSDINPQGCDVHAFKQPSPEELAHDFLWRAARRLPERGRIGIFNRSYYEDVVVVRVHPEFLDKQKLPAAVAGKDIWAQRFDDICGFERHLARSGTLVLKFFLNVSREEQRQRLLDRLDEPGKRWKFSMGDIAERALWPKYMAAYDSAIRTTSTKEAPWFVVPADRKWLARLVVASALVEAMERLGLDYPVIEGDALKEMAKVREALEAEARDGSKQATTGEK